MQKRALEGFQLSPQQHRVWLLQQADGQVAYRACCVVGIQGRLDAATFQTAVDTVLQRQEVLRTCFRCLPGMSMPLQVITEGYRCAIRERDLSGLSSHEQNVAIEEFYQEERQIPLDYERGPILSLLLVKRSADSQTLLITLPALCADKTTLELLISDIGRSYVASVHPESPLDESIQYADVSAVFNELIESDDTQVGRDYWRKKDIQGGLDLKLPFENKSVGRRRFDPHCFTVNIEPSLQVRCETLVSQWNVPLATVLLGCWQVLLWRHTGAPAFVVGAALDGRTYEGLDKALGLFARHLPLQCHLGEEVRFAQLCQQTDRFICEMSEWQEYFSCEERFRSTANGIDEPAGHVPFFPYCFDDQGHIEACRAGDITLFVDKLSVCFERFKIQLSCVRREEKLAVELHYDASCFSDTAIQCLADQLLAVLESVVDQPEANLGQLEMIGARERRLLLQSFNRTESVYPTEQCVHHLFEEQVERSPDAVAVVCEDDHLTYRGLNVGANQLAFHLRSLGVGPDVVVGICMESCPEILVAMLGTLKAGGAYLPLDPKHPKARLAFMLEDAGATVLVTQRRMQERLPAHRARVVDLDTNWSSSTPSQEDNPRCQLQPENLCYVIYTSGSTGQPKGTMVPHRGLVNYLKWCATAYEVEKGCGAPVHSSIGWDLTITSMFPPLLVGKRVVVTSEPQGVDGLVTLLRHHGDFSLVKITPAHVAALNHLLSPEEVAGMTRRLVIGGEALAGTTLDFWQRHSPATRYVNEYGPTETVVGCCVYELAADEPIVGNVPIGKPIANTELYILDARHEPTPLGVTGELHISGAGVARGYRGQPDVTAERFIPNPFSVAPGDRLYRTGDLARYLPDGTLECLGRLDHQVKIRGFRVELDEIESVLRRHVGVADAVVLLREDGGEEKRLVGYVVPRTGQRVGAQELSIWLQQSVPDYMIPSAVVVLERLPRTTNGKIDRKALPAPDVEKGSQEQSYLIARTPIEEIVGGIWAEVLRLPQVGIYDDFFRLGGHSLLATQVISRIRQTLHVELPLHTLFERPTIHGLAASIDALRAAGGTCALPIERIGLRNDVPLSFAQQRLWFLDQLRPTSSDYNIATILRLEGELSVRALRWTVLEVVRRHEILRTRFVDRGGGPIQDILPVTDVPLPVVDLQQYSDALRDGQAHNLATEEARRPFDLAQGPLLRVHLLRLGRREHVLVLTLHHIVSDAWSVGVLIREFTCLYQAFLIGEASSLPELPLQYSDYAVWQRRYLQGDVLEAHLGYWRRQLHALPPPLHFPGELRRDSLHEFDGGHELFQLSTTQTEDLRQVSQQHGVTLFMTLLAGFNILLRSYTGQHDIVIGTNVANRNRAETEGLIGFFVNQLVLRTDLSGDPNLAEVLRRVRDTTLAAHSYQDLPFDELVRALRPERDPSGQAPFFRIKVDFENAMGLQLELPALRISRLNLGSILAHANFTLILGEKRGSIVGAVVHDKAIYPSPLVKGIIHDFQWLLEQAVTGAELRLSEWARLLAEVRAERLRLRGKQLEEAGYHKLKSLRHTAKPDGGSRTTSSAIQ